MDKFLKSKRAKKISQTFHLGPYKRHFTPLCPIDSIGYISKKRERITHSFVSFNFSFINSFCLYIESIIPFVSSLISSSLSEILLSNHLEISSRATSSTSRGSFFLNKLLNHPMQNPEFRVIYIFCLYKQKLRPSVLNGYAHLIRNVEHKAPLRGLQVFGRKAAVWGLAPHDLCLNFVKV